MGGTTMENFGGQFQASVEMMVVAVSMIVVGWAVGQLTALVLRRQRLTMLGGMIGGVVGGAVGLAAYRSYYLVSRSPSLSVFACTVLIGEVIAAVAFAYGFSVAGKKKS